MSKRIVVAGCREYKNYEEAKEYIDFCISKIREDEDLIFLSGGCRGADLLGERYARENGFELEIYPANWEKYGRAAGPKRNREMVSAADYIICFWDGKSRGTKTLVEFARRANKPLRIKKIIINN